MKLKVFTNIKQQKDEVFLGKYGQLRFKKLFAERFNLVKGEIIQVAIDEDEKVTQSIYLIKTDTRNGFMVSFGNSQFYMALKDVSNQMGFKAGSRFMYKEFEEAGYKGMKLTLIKPTV